MSRRFQFVSGNSSKFWGIDKHQNQVTVRFGRIGTDGQTQSKTLNDAASAAKHAEKQISAKLQKGYVEVP